MHLTTFSDIKLPVTSPESQLKNIAQKKLGKPLGYFAIKKKSLDARDKSNLRYVYTVECSAQPYTPQKEPLQSLPKARLSQNATLVVGSGPAGLFCALRLLDRGIRPIVIERGGSVDERALANNRFFKERILDENCNIQFGEGGAGTFSDGKLNTQTHSPLNREVLETFVRYGAPEEILYFAKPHIGSDKLQAVVKAMREDVIRRGGEVHFHTRLQDVEIKDGRVISATLWRFNAYTPPAKPTYTEEKMAVSAVILAIGHSARDTFETLHKRGVTMRQKDFAVGVRIEHLQEKISLAQYGKSYSLLPPADYKLVSHTPDRSAFTFCMCPGGYVMPSASEEGGVVTNGMSNFARDGINANSALIAQVRAEDFGSAHALAGIEYQRKLERAAYLAGGSSYRAPVQRLEDFLSNKPSTRLGEVQPTYAAGVQLTNLNEFLPTPVAQALRYAVTDMDKRLRGFAHPDALLTGVESRTSAPVRIERDERLQSVNVQGLYPCGEGAGYAGGITSSAADGIRVADAVYLTYLG